MVSCITNCANKKHGKKEIVLLKMFMRNYILECCFVGNGYIHQMSIYGAHELSVLLEDRFGNKTYANYSKFSVGDEQGQFLLHVNGYHGDAGKNMQTIFQITSNVVPIYDYKLLHFHM